MTDSPGSAPEMDLLRFTTAGSVDDGKSTLIGRLLFDSKLIFEDQLEALQASADLTGEGQINLANLTDGLRSEREQGITIDVAYRYFATPRRKFIIADAPGHVQYTRNMVTGASTANLALILVDARQGVTSQTRRHAYIASLLRIPHLVLCINKMDLVGWSEERFREIRSDFEAFSARMQIQDITYIPASALQGDNVVEPSTHMPWYEGKCLLRHLEDVHIVNDRNFHEKRLPVQVVIRPHSDAHHDFRGYAGQVAGGIFRAGDPVMVVPSMKKSKVKAVHGPEGETDEVFTPMSATLELEDDIDIGRGDMIVGQDYLPRVDYELHAMACWMDDRAPLRKGTKYLLKLNARTTRAMVTQIAFKVDIETLEKDRAAQSLDLNDIGRIALRTLEPVAYDMYRRNRSTGAFILVDEVTHQTAAVGMICEPLPESETEPPEYMI